MFPRKFLGFKLTGLLPTMARLKAKSVDVLFAFNEVTTRLSAAVRPDMFALYAAPAINLFEKTTDRIAIKPNFHEYHVVPDRSRYLDFEPHRVIDVYAHYAGGQEKVPVRPLYSASVGRSAGTAVEDVFYTVRRLPRRRTAEERRRGSVVRLYRHRHVHLVRESSDNADNGPVELSLRTLCSNRHLTEHIPVGEGGADFRFLDDVDARHRLRRRPDAAARAGGVAASQPQRNRPSQAPSPGGWSTCSASITSAWWNAAAERTLPALREILSMFADLADSTTERKIRGIRSVDSRTVIRRIRERFGIGAGARHRDHRDARRKGLRRQRRLPAGRHPRSIFRGICGAQSLHRNRHPHDRTRRDHALAAAHGHAEAAVTQIDEMKEEPWRFDFFSVMRWLERTHPQRPRIGDSAAWREEYVRLGQDPYHGFPGLEPDPCQQTTTGRLRIFVKFLGLLGPQGALAARHDRGKPSAGSLSRDDAFPRFLDIFNHRFLQLFFRAWADSRPIAQHDRPEGRPLRRLYRLDDRHRHAAASRPRFRPRCRQDGFAGLIGAADASRASRLQAVSQRSVRRQGRDRRVRRYLRLRSNPPTGRGSVRPTAGSAPILSLGASMFSVQDKIRIRIFTKDHGAISALPADRRPMRTAGRSRYSSISAISSSGRSELAIPAGAVRAGPAWTIRPARLDQLDGAELDLDR